MLALAAIICKTLGEVGSILGLGGKLLIVISAPTVVKVHPWVVFGEEDGEGLKERSKEQG